MDWKNGPCFPKQCHLFTLLRGSFHLARLAKIASVSSRSAFAASKNLALTFALEELRAHSIAEQKVRPTFPNRTHSPFPTPNNEMSTFFNIVFIHLQAPRCGQRSSGRMRRQTCFAGSNILPLSQKTRSGSSPLSHTKYLLQKHFPRDAHIFKPIPAAILCVCRLLLCQLGLHCLREQRRCKRLLVACFLLSAGQSKQMQPNRSLC